MLIIQLLELRIYYDFQWVWRIFGNYTEIHRNHTGPERAITTFASDAHGDLRFPKGFMHWSRWIPCAAQWCPHCAGGEPWEVDPLIFRIYCDFQWF